MYRKIFLFVFGICLFALASGASAANGVGSAQSPAPVQTQTANQGSVNQIQTTTQAQNNDVPGAGSQTVEQVREQQRLRDGSGDGQQVKNQNGQPTGNQQSQGNGQTASRGQGSPLTGESRRSQVANAVQAMLQIADRDQGIGEQVRVIAQAQNQNQEQLETHLEKIQERSGFAKFFIGPNYQEIRQANATLAQNREQIQQLNQLKTELKNQGDQTQLTAQIQLLEQVNAEIENQLGDSQKGFSLLGWMFKLFNK